MQNMSNSTNPIRELPHAFQMADLSVRLFEGLFAVLTNGFTMLIIAKHEFLHTNTNLLVANLAAGDLFSGFSPIFLILHYNWQTQPSVWVKLCAAEIYLNLVSVAINIQTIALVSVNRFVYINFPLRYHSLVRKWIIVTAIVLTWTWILFILSTFTALGTTTIMERFLCRTDNIFVYAGLLRYVLNSQLVFFSAVIILLYSRIGCIAYKQAQLMKNAAVPEASGITKRENKVTKMMGLVLGVYFACYLPQYAVIVAVAQFRSPPLWLDMLERVGAWIWWVNSWLNPFIYAWKSRDINRAFRLQLGLKTNQVSTQ